EREEMEGQDEDEEGSREDGKSSRLRFFKFHRLLDTILELDGCYGIKRVLELRVSIRSKVKMPYDSAEVAISWYKIAQDRFSDIEAWSSSLLKKYVLMIQE
ncbi:hypothetical protein Tco_0228782, partial [Tanacetum coccineum]